MKQNKKRSITIGVRLWLVGAVCFPGQGRGQRPGMSLFTLLSSPTGRTLHTKGRDQSPEKGGLSQRRTERSGPLQGFCPGTRVSSVEKGARGSLLVVLRLGPQGPKGSRLVLPSPGCVYRIA